MRNYSNFEEFRKGNMSNALFDQFNKEAKDSWDQFAKMLQMAINNARERIIETSIGGTGAKYRTTIRLDGDVINAFPGNVVDDDDKYWKRHNSLVDNILQTRKEIVLSL